LPSLYKQDQDLLALARTAQASGVNVFVINAGECLKEGAFSITCLQPAVNDKELTGNASSMVLEAQYGEFSMLCTGDVEGKGEELLLRKVAGKEYDVLKVAHHGSKYSTSERFLKLCSPDIALISAGKDNRYGHPHKELLKRLENADCKIYNTQENGAIMLETDGNLYYSIREYVKKGEQR
jgi:competence protein ComEC